MCMKLFGTSTPSYSRRNNYYFWHRALRKLSARLYPASTVSKSTYKNSRSVFYTKKSKLHSWNSYPRKQSVYPFSWFTQCAFSKRQKNGPGLHRTSLKTRICRDIKWCNRLCSCSRICGCHNFGVQELRDKFHNKSNPPDHCLVDCGSINSTIMCFFNIYCHNFWTILRKQYYFQTTEIYNLSEKTENLSGFWQSP